jgi:hypothetical protein
MEAHRNRQLRRAALLRPGSAVLVAFGVGFGLAWGIAGGDGARDTAMLHERAPTATLAPATAPDPAQMPPSPQPSEAPAAAPALAHPRHAAQAPGLSETEHVSPPQDAAVCGPASLPVGALPGQDPPVFCRIGNDGPPTFVDYPNGWLDTFTHGLKHAGIGAGYRVYDGLASVHRTITWRHNDHWMVDVSGVDDTPDDGPYNAGGTMMRPDRSFRFEDGVLVVEVQVAAGIDAYGGGAWPEIVVTTAPAPTFGRRGSLYAYDEFAGHDTVGCRLQSERAPICALFDSSERGAGDGGRVWEVSYFQSGDAASVFGGGPFEDLASAWRLCQGDDPDVNCRDTFRWEIARDRLTLYVNGVKYMEHSGFPAALQLPDRMLEGDVYVYFGSWINKPQSEAVRFHWGALSINPPPAAVIVPSR